MEMNSKRNRQKVTHISMWQRDEDIQVIEALRSQVQYLNMQQGKKIRRIEDLNALVHCRTLQLEDSVQRNKALEDENQRIKKANERMVAAEKIATAGRQILHEPSLQSSTYIPKRNYSTQSGWHNNFVLPFIFIMLLSVVLAAAFVLAIPSLGDIISPVFDILIRVLFLIVSVSTFVSFVLNICDHHNPK
jgi:hypothetical protein